MEIINLNLIPGKAWPVAHATQFDKGREFRANLFEGSQVYTLAGDETVDAIIKKPDGNQVTEALVNTADNYVIVSTTEQMTAVAGPSLGEIRITKDDTVIGSLKFILECEQSADTGIASHSEINNLEAQVAAIVADQYAAEDVVFDNTPTAGHGVGFAVTSEGVLNAIPDELNDLSDVDINSAAVGEALVWNGAEWVNGTVSTVGSIDDLNDVDTTGKANADSLRYNATAQEWEAKPTTVEMTLAEYTALGGDYSGYENTNIIITDAPNLNATAQDISYDGGADTVWDKVEEIGTELTAAWTASTTSAYGTNLTDSITVTKGTWVIAWGHPNQSGDIGCFISGIDTNSDISDQFITFDGGKELTKGVIVAKFTGNATLRVASGASASVTFSNTTRGFLRAVKVSA